MKHVIWLGGLYITTSDSINLEQLNSKQDKLISGINIATVNKQDLTKGGNVDIKVTGSIGKIDNTIDALNHGEVFNDYEKNLATGIHSHAEGENNIASGDLGSHAEGDSNKAVGYLGSHAEGYKTYAGGASSHTEGLHTITKGIGSHAEGFGTISDNYCQHTQGIYNKLEKIAKPDSYDPNNTLFSIGNGVSDSERSDALKMLGNGTLWVSGIGTFTGTNADETNSILKVLENFKTEVNSLKTLIDNLKIENNTLRDRLNKLSVEVSENAEVTARALTLLESEITVLKTNNGGKA